MRKLILLCAVLGAAFSASAQGLIYNGEVRSTRGPVLPGVQVNVCTSGATGVPCSPQATVYSDPGLTVPITQPIIVDQNGKFSFYGNPGTSYVISESGQGISTSFPIQLPSAGSGCTVGGSPGALQKNNGASGCNAAAIVDNGSTITASEPTVVPSLNKVVKADQEVGATADVKIAAAIASLPTGGTVDARGFGATSQTIAATVTVPTGITILFDPKTYYAAGSAALNLFKLEPDAAVDGFTLDCTSQPTYSGNVFENDTAAAYVDGNNTRADNITILCSGVTTGTGLFLSSTASGTAVVWIGAHHWRQYGLLNQILATASGNGFVNDNHFVDMQMSGGGGTSVQLHLTPNGGQVDANQCIQCSFQSHSTTDLGFLIDGTSGANDDASNNLYVGDCWDSTVDCANFSGNSKATNNQTVGFFNIGVSDANGANGLVSQDNLSTVNSLYIGGFPTENVTQITHNSSSTVSGVTGTNYCLAQAHVNFLQCLDNSGNMGLAGAIKSVGATFTGTVDASGATQFKLPVAASYTSAANGEIGYNSTDLNWHLFGNGIDNIKAIFPASLSITNGHCVNWSKVGTVITLADAGSACGSGGGGSGLIPSVFIATTNCNSLSNCVAWTADDSTDNCGAATTAWLSSIASYSGAGLPQVYIVGGNASAYKFTSCALTFTNPNGTHIHSWANIDCGQASGNCIQLGQTGLVAYQRSLFTFDGWGTLLGGASLTTAGIECESFIGWCQVSQTYFSSFGPVNATGGSCTGYAIQFDSPVAESDAHDNWWESQTGGQCAINNTDSTSGGGQNTARIYGNHIAGGMAAACGSVAIVEGGDHSSVHDNSIWGFDIPIRVQNISSAGPETGTMITENSLDNAGCTAHSVSAAINFGGISSTNVVGPVVISNNNVPGGASHETYLVALAGDTSSTIKGVTLTGNQADVTGISIMPPSLACTAFAATFNPCYESGNQNLSEVTGNGWILRNQFGGAYQALQTANIASTPTGLVPMAMGATATCYVEVTRVATSSSTLPSCTVSWTDNDTSTVETTAVTTTNTGNTVGTQSSGSVVMYPKVGTAINYSTSGYASSGATSMQYTVLVRLAAQ